MAPIGPVAKRKSEKAKHHWSLATGKIARASAVASTLQQLRGTSSQEKDRCPVDEVLSQKPEARTTADVYAALTWWLEGVPLSGCSLAPEVRAAPDIALLKAFQRGKLVSCVRNQSIQEEGEDVKYFTVILFGSCTSRSRLQALRGDGDKEYDFVNIQDFGRGDSLGLFPPMRAPYSVISTQSTSLLQLNVADYDAIFRAHHKQYFAKTVEFLQKHRVCPDATSQQLSRLAHCLRLVKFPPEKVLFRAGEVQTHIWLLGDGMCQVSVHDSPDGPTGDVPIDDNAYECETRVYDHQQLDRLRGNLIDAPSQTAVACEERKKNLLAKFARGQLKSQMEGQLPGDTICGVIGGDTFHAVTLQTPGTMLGEEVFVRTNLKVLGGQVVAHHTQPDWARSRYAYTAKTKMQSSFYVIEITSFHQLAQRLKMLDMARSAQDKLDTRFSVASRGKTFAKRIQQEVLEAHVQDLLKQERRKVRLPNCAGPPEVHELEAADLDDFLTVVGNHRVPPFDCSNLPTLTCLEGTPFGPKSAINGPVTNRLLQAKLQARRLQHRKVIAKEDLADGMLLYGTDNPLGRAPANARYVDSKSQTKSDGSGNCSLEAGTSFLPLLGESVHNASRSSTPADAAMDAGGMVCVRSPGTVIFASGLGDDSTAEALSHVRLPQTSASMALSSSFSSPGFRMPSHAGARLGDSSGLEREVPNEAMNRKSLSLGNIAEPFASSPFRPSASSTRSSPGKRPQNVVEKNAFIKVMAGKSVLALTDSADLRKAMAHILLSDNVKLSLAKTSQEVWMNLCNPKENYSVLLVDLTKKDLQVDSLLHAIRQDQRYSMLPVVAISMKLDLPQNVRHQCSYAIYLPLTSTALREALVWCCNRRCAERSFRLEGATASAEQNSLCN